MSGDQFGNHVDREIYVPLKAPEYPMPVPLRTVTEYGFAFADGRIAEERYDSEGEARMELVYKRKWLENLGIPEEYWPVLMERTVETVASSWRILSV